MYDTLLDGISDVITMARDFDDDADMLMHGYRCAIDRSYFAGHITADEWNELVAMCWDLHGYAMLMFKDAA